MFSKRAFVFGALVAFVVGVAASLAIRPANQTVASVAAENGEKPIRAKWRVPLSASRNLPGNGETPVWVSTTIEKASAGGLVLELFDPGEIVPAFAITDAVRDRKVQAGYTWLGYDQGKIPSSALFGATPFGLDPVGYTAWWFFGGGRELAEGIYAAHHIKPILCGMTGPETAGWFAEPVESMEQLRGLKIRFAGVGGKVMQRIGASITMLPAGEIFQALETGVIDATEFSQPVSDQALGFARIAKFNYYPGWHQPFSATHMVINREIWDGLDAADQTLIEGICTAGVTFNLGLTESLQGPVIAGFDEIGVTAMSFSTEILREIKAVAEEVLDEEANNDADFKAVLASQRQFKEVYALWKKRAYLPGDL